MPQVQSHPCFLTPKRLQPEYPLFVFLPGMDGTGQLLRSQTTGLEAAFDVRCLMLPPEERTSWDVLTKQVIDLIAAELDKNSRRSVYLCGESFGGALAIKIALKAPELFQRVVLVNPASALHRRPWLDWASQLVYLVPSCLFEIGALGLLPFLVSLGRTPRSDRQDILKTMRSVPPETVLWRLSLIREFDVDDRQLRQITQPVLLIASALDRLLPSIAEARYLVKNLPNANMVILPYSGHACLVEADINLYKLMQQQHFLDANAKAIAVSN
ncbi:alpha/beta fold hydrolase [Aliterella atlantica]|uniref:Alpha/beta hydrolase n=1 Tax=Aliterella atlantica CENA595 TaxID=1618023 RepID=A0A0D8ZVV3_9CYAN|nr:alpha/beta hydrolase [Aliterella atlantica]KJH72903.1 alpha/beta hydrolase [Aliterella atlantica CENA595]